MVIVKTFDKNGQAEILNATFIKRRISDAETLHHRYRVCVISQFVGDFRRWL